MTTDIAPLFTPFRLAGLDLPNRLAMSPMTRSRAPDGVPGPANVDYYRRRADMGLIFTEGTWIGHPAAGTDESVPRFYGDDALAGWSGVVNAVHEAGGRIMPQLWHIGLFDGEVGDGSTGAADHLVGPSGYVGGMGKAPVKFKDPATPTEIDAIVEAFAAAAEAAFRIGCDGVALHGAHGYLIDQFLWDATNKRDDRFGGGLADRSRFAVEVVEECRRRTAPDFPIVLRISQWKLQDYEARMVHTPAELAAIVEPLAAAGVDLFDCSQRRFWEPAFADGDLNLAGWVKRLTGKATMTVGSVGLDVDLVESLGGAACPPASLSRVVEGLERGEYDIVGVGRAVLADVEWTAKVQRGDLGSLLPFTRDALTQLV